MTVVDLIVAGAEPARLASTLLAAVERAGVDVVPTQAREVVADGSGVRVDGHRGRHLTVAVGLHSPLRRRPRPGWSASPSSRPSTGLPKGRHDRGDRLPRRRAR